jgi:YHS domain-containing protein
MRINRVKLAFSTLSVLVGAGLYIGSVQAAETLSIVENEKVCMVTDMHFPKKQIPVTHDGKTYYGCCENCKETLAKDSKARTAIDPVSGMPVDKARAVIAARADHSVVYFESKKNFDTYLKSAGSGKPNDKPTQGGHVH